MADIYIALGITATQEVINLYTGRSRSDALKAADAAVKEHVLLRVEHHRLGAPDRFHNYRQRREPKPESEEVEAPEEEEDAETPEEEEPAPVPELSRQQKAALTRKAMAAAKAAEATS